MKEAAAVSEAKHDEDLLMQWSKEIRKQAEEPRFRRRRFDRDGNREIGPHEAQACEKNRMKGMQGEVGSLLQFKDMGGGHADRRDKMLTEVGELKQQLQNCKLDGLGSHLESLMQLQAQVESGAAHPSQYLVNPITGEIQTRAFGVSQRRQAAQSSARGRGGGSLSAREPPTHTPAAATTREVGGDHVTTTTVVFSEDTTLAPTPPPPPPPPKHATGSSRSLSAREPVTQWNRLRGPDKEALQEHPLRALMEEGRSSVPGEPTDIRFDRHVKDRAFEAAVGSGLPATPRRNERFQRTFGR